MLKISNLNKGIFASLALMLVVSLFAPIPADAASRCLVRAGVTGPEVQQITGTNRGGENAGTSLMLTGAQAGENALICGFALIKWIANVIFAVLIAIAVLMIAYGAYLFVTAGSQPANVEKARKVMLWAIIGLIIASIAKLIPNIASTILGFS
ncbi:MAG: hypothetical protein WDZ40_02670 [Candidatus Spechtbacterales bacterium]